MGSAVRRMTRVIERAGRKEGLSFETESRTVVSGAKTQVECLTR